MDYTHLRTRTDGNSGYTASISIGSGLHASGGSATVTASGSHTYWYYDSYTSGSRVPSSGVNTSSQNDGASWVISSNGNNRFSKSNNTLSHSSMGTNETTDTVYVKATNSNNSSATAQTYTSITNSRTRTDGNSGYTASISIGSGLAASGGSATVTASGSHTYWYYDSYTSGSRNPSSGVNASSQSDGASWVISSNGNNRFSKDGNTLIHSHMQANPTTDTVYVKATNSNNSGATAQTYTSIVNKIEYTSPSLEAQSVTETNLGSSFGGTTNKPTASSFNAYIEVENEFTSGSVIYTYPTGVNYSLSVDSYNGMYNYLRVYQFQQ